MMTGEGYLDGGSADARDALGSLASEVERRVEELGSAVAPQDKEHAGQLVMDARQSLQEEVPPDRLRSLSSELRKVLSGLSPE